MPFSKGQIPNPTGKGGFSSQYGERTKAYKLPISLGDRLKRIVIDPDSLQLFHQWLDTLDTD